MTNGVEFVKRFSRQAFIPLWIVHLLGSTNYSFVDTYTSLLLDYGHVWSITLSDRTATVEKKV